MCVCVCARACAGVCVCVFFWGAGVGNAFVVNVKLNSLWHKMLHLEPLLP